MINKLSFASNMALASVYAIFILLALLSVLSPDEQLSSTGKRKQSPFLRVGGYTKRKLYRFMMPLLHLVLK